MGHSKYGSKATKRDEAQEARDAAKDKITESVQEVEKGMKCGECGRVCYKTWDKQVRCLY